MSANKLLEQLWVENKELITIEEHESIAKDLYYDYKRIIQWIFQQSKNNLLFNQISYILPLVYL